PFTSVVADLAGHSANVTRDEFEDRTRSLLLQSQALLEHVLQEAEQKHGLTKDKIDVLLAGGSSRMPMVKKMIEGVLGKPPLMHKTPERVVTIGAAYWAHLLEAGAVLTTPAPDETGRPRPTEVVVGGLTDVSTYPVGVEVLRPDGRGGYGRYNSVVVPEG